MDIINLPSVLFVLLHFYLFSPFLLLSAVTFYKISTVTGKKIMPVVSYTTKKDLIERQEGVTVLMS